MDPAHPNVKAMIRVLSRSPYDLVHGRAHALVTLPKSHSAEHGLGMTMIALFGPSMNISFEHF